MDTPRATSINAPVIDEKRTTVGTVTDVLYAGDSNTPKWLVVNPGLLRAERFVPVEGSYDSDDGCLVIPFDKRWVKEAPKARNHVLSGAIESAAIDHYGLQHS
ncbi:MAG: PRC-barrel domain-containing protein [Ilumatobacter sp.]